MDTETRRKMYRVGFIPLENIPVWKSSGELNTQKILIIYNSSFVLNYSTKIKMFELVWCPKSV